MIKVADFDILTAIRSCYFFFVFSKMLSWSHNPDYGSFNIGFVFIGLSMSYDLNRGFGRLTQLMQLFFY